MPFFSIIVAAIPHAVHLLCARRKSACEVVVVRRSHIRPAFITRRKQLALILIDSRRPPGRSVHWTLATVVVVLSSFVYSS